MSISECIGTLHWEACEDCLMFEEVTGDCPMDGLDLIVEGDAIRCGLYTRRKK